MDDFQGSAVLMHTSAQLMALLPSQGPKQLKLQKTAYALAAAAGLQVHEAMPQHAGGQCATAGTHVVCACNSNELIELRPSTQVCGVRMILQKTSRCGSIWRMSQAAAAAS
jgi:hypothetical protein